jgi:hypothetical protein
VTTQPLAVVREYIVSPYSSKREADIAWEALDRIEEALREMAAGFEAYRAAPDRLTGLGEILNRERFVREALGV